MNEPGTPTELPPPPAAPADELEHDLRLALVPGIGPRLRQLLLARFGTARLVLAAAQSSLREVDGIGPKLAKALAAAAASIDVQTELKLCAKHNVSILRPGDPAYPRALGRLPDPPGILYSLGQVLPRDELCLAIVGSRHATQYGLTQAERLAASLAHAGLTIVSGLARGIDAAAHKGALEAGGRTLAVLGSGVLNVYPPEHVALSREVVEHGALLSEQPVRAVPLAGSFPQRNRLISGLSLGVIVVEAADRSGALITARHAVEQDREVFAVPGRVDSRLSRGCHRLIRDGAKLVQTADDVLEELGPLVSATPVSEDRVVHHPGELLLNPAERTVLDAIRCEPTLIDQIITDSGMATPQVLSALSVLEVRRLVKRIGGNYAVRV